MQGQVKFFDIKRHFGFICLTDESAQVVFAEYFFSGNDVIGDFPQRGDLVNFIIEDPPSRAHKRNLIAVEVERIARGERVAVEVFEERLTEEVA